VGLLEEDVDGEDENRVSFIFWASNTYERDQITSGTCVVV